MILRYQLVLLGFFPYFLSVFVRPKRRRKKLFPWYKNHVTIVFTRDIIKAPPSHLRCLTVSRLDVQIIKYLGDLIFLCKHMT